MRHYFQGYVWWRVSLVYVLLSVSLFTFAGVTNRGSSVSVLRSADSEMTTELATKPDLAIKGMPTRIHLPTIKVDLQVVAGIYNESHREWSVSDSAANYATNTYVPNNISGTTLIYGHDTDAVFNKIRNLKHGDEVYVYTDTGRVFSYVYDVTKTKRLRPNDTTMFNELGSSPRIQLMTCDGLWSQERLLLSLSFKGVV